MNKIIFILIKKILLIILSFILISITGIYLYSTQYLKTSDGSYIDKINKLKSLKEKKAVFVGGSATHFGIHALLFEKLTGIKTVNMGLNAGVSFQMYIDSVIPYLKEGDMLFIMPEYSYYSSEYNAINENSINFMYILNPEISNNMSIFEKIKFIPETLTVGWRNWGSSAQEFMKSILFKGNYGIYYRFNSNIYGDMEGQKGLDIKPINPTNYIYKKKGFIKKLRENIIFLNQNGIKVFLLFPPYRKASFEIAKEQINYVYEDIKKIKDATILYTPNNSVYSNESFYDTDYHLTWEIAEKHTIFIVSCLDNMK